VDNVRPGAASIDPVSDSLARAVGAAQTGSVFMFQEILYDGLIGDRFLRNFIVTYDLPRSRMIFTLPSNAAAEPRLHRQPNAGPPRPTPAA